MKPLFRKCSRKKPVKHCLTNFSSHKLYLTLKKVGKYQSRGSGFSSNRPDKIFQNKITKRFFSKIQVPIEYKIIKIFKNCVTNYGNHIQSSSRITSQCNGTLSRETQHFINSWTKYRINFQIQQAIGYIYEHLIFYLSFIFKKYTKNCLMATSCDFI